MKPSHQPWIMIAGPYSSGALNEEEKRRNLDILNQAALILFNHGYLPIIGVSNALPLIMLDKSPDAFDRIMMPYSLALCERCDSCLRIGGPSKGADEEVQRFRAAGKPVYFSLEEVFKLENSQHFPDAH